MTKRVLREQVLQSRLKAETILQRERLLQYRKSKALTTVAVTWRLLHPRSNESVGEPQLMTRSCEGLWRFMKVYDLHMSCLKRSRVVLRSGNSEVRRLVSQQRMVLLFHAGRGLAHDVNRHYVARADCSKVNSRLYVNPVSIASCMSRLHSA